LGKFDYGSAHASRNHCYTYEQCPSAQRVYNRRAGGSSYTDSGGVSNPQCLSLDPNYLNTLTGGGGIVGMFGAEYET